MISVHRAASAEAILIGCDTTDTAEAEREFAVWASENRVRVPCDAPRLTVVDSAGAGRSWVVLARPATAPRTEVAEVGGDVLRIHARRFGPSRFSPDDAA